MPNTKSAIKAARQNIKRREVNLKVLETLRKAVKLARKTPSNESLSKAFAALDKAAKKGVIHKNNASRKKSRLAKLLKKSAK